MSFPSDEEGFPEHQDEWDPQPKPQRNSSGSAKWIIGCLLSVVVVLGLVCGLGAWIATSTFSNFQAAVPHMDLTFRAAKSEPKVGEALGKPVQLDFMFQNDIQVQEQGDKTIIEASYRIYGPKGEGTVHFRAEKQGKRWSYREAYAEVPGVPGKVPLRGIKNQVIDEK